MIKPDLSPLSIKVQHKLCVWISGTTCMVSILTHWMYMYLEMEWGVHLFGPRKVCKTPSNL